MSADTRFVGREKERRSFQRLLDNPYGEERLKFIWGPGGIGKTWLAQAMLEDAKAHQFRVAKTVIDTYSTNTRHIEGVIEAIIEQLGLPKDAFANYLEEKGKLDAARQQEGYAQAGLEAQLGALAVAFRHDLQAVAQAHPMVLAFDTFEHVQDTPVGRWILSEDGLQIPGMICIVAGRKTNPFDRDQLSLGGLSDSEAVNFANYYFSKRLGEWNTSEVSLINNRVNGNPILLGLAMLAGVSDEECKTLDQATFQNRLVSWLKPGDSSQPGEFFPNIPLELEGSDSIRQTLVCMAYLNRRFNQKLLDHLLKEQYVTSGSPDKLWQILGSNLPDFFYVKQRPEGEIQLHDKLAEMLRLLVMPEARFEWPGKLLQDFASDVVRWYDDLISEATGELEKAILQVEKLAYVLRLDVLSDIEQPEWQDTSEAEQLARLLPPDFKNAQDLITKYRREHSDVLNRLVISEIQPSLAGQFPLADQYDVCSLLGEMARDAYLLQDSASYWRHAFLAAQENGDVPQQIVALRWESNSTWQQDSQKALALLHQAEKLCDQSPELSPQILYSIGFVYRQMQDLETAVKWYNDALENAKLHDSERLIIPTILNDTGYALLLIGQYDKAEARIKMAALLRERNRDKVQAKLDEIQNLLANESDPTKLNALGQLKVQAKEAWRDASLKLGMTYNTLGQLARQNPSDLTDATVYYDEALDIFVDSQINDLYWQAQALQAKGDALRRLALDFFFKERHVKSQDHDQQAFNDIETSLKYCIDYGYVDLLPIVHRRKGRLLHDRALRATSDLDKQTQLLQEALEQFLVGIKTAQQSGNILEELENSTEIAFLTDDFIRSYRRQRSGKQLTRHQREEVQAHIEQFHKTIEAHQDDEHRIYHFSVFNDLYKIEQGAFQYEMGDYTKAFDYYSEGYTGLASDPGYGSARCRAHFEHLLGNIRKLPDPQMKQNWYQNFIDTWQTTLMQRNGGKTIAEAHPKLIEQFELHRMFE